MKQTALFIGLFLLIAPAFASAQTPTCSAQGYTVVFVNGVFDTETEAHEDNDALKQKFGSFFNGQPVTFQLGYNPTHLAGAGDILQSFAQQFNSSVTDFDLDTILMQIYPEVTTRKLLVVGHSQGADYANEMYSYLLAHGEPKEAVGVYAVATPANYVAGGGKYLTSSTDKVMSFVITAAAVALQDGLQVSQPLSANIELPFSAADEASPLGGHAFAADYLAGASTRMTSDIDGELGALVPTYASSNSDCFTPPDASVGYKTQQAIFTVADPTATVLKVGAVTTVQASLFALNTAATLAEGVYQFVADAFSLATNPPSEPQTAGQTLKIANKLYGSSLDGLSAQDKKDLLGSSQGGAVALAVAQPKTPAASGAVLGTSTGSVPQTSAPISTPGSIFPYSSNGPVFGGGGAPALPQSIPTIAPSEPAPDDVLASDDTSSIVVDDTASSTDEIATTTTDETQNTTSDTPPIIDNTPPSTTGSIIASQPDSSGTPSHYWHSDGTMGAYLVLDPNDGHPGYSIGNIATTTTPVVGIHIKVQVNSDGYPDVLPNIPKLYDESGTYSYACAQLPYGGNAYGSAADAMTNTNPLAYSDFNGKMVDMYFQCNLGVGHDQVYANTSYRLYFYPISTADISDIYVAMNAAGDTPFYEISSDGVY